MIAEVIVDIANSEIDKIFDYIARENTQIGQRVKVPFGNRYIDGYVINMKESSDLPIEKLKTVGESIDDYPVLLYELLCLANDMIIKNYLRYVDCMRLFVPSQLRKKTTNPIYINYVKVIDNYNAEDYMCTVRANANKQKEMYTFLKPNKEYLQSDLNKKFGISNINNLLQKGILVQYQKQKMRRPYVIERICNNVNLNDCQQKIVNDILGDRNKTHLIFGVTGSGKTEVYMNIISKVLDEGKNAILLVPEISLTPQVMSTFIARFGDNVALLHSGLSDGEKFDEWQRIRLGNARIVIGARSAIFAPLENIGVIIIDEEHDPSYKSESNPRFLTHDVAEFRTRFNKCPLVLGSATPSLESFTKAKNGEYVLHTLIKRANNKEMPNINIINMCDEIKNGNTSMFSQRLLDELDTCIKNNEQAMIFLNRRGYSSYIICRECGYVAKCEDCDVALVYHKADNQLKCHYCNKRYKALDECPKCHSQYIRLGATGTQKVVSELEQIFPNVKILRLDVDTTKNKNDLVNILNKFANTKPCVLVGTQMIAKGHDFPNVTLVGILDADMSLHFCDYRATERTFQLITQVSGRAGRAEKSGKVILQTYTPKHYVYQYAKNYDYNSFYNKEINLRNVTNFPPFSRIIRILITGDNDMLTQDYTLKLLNELAVIKKDYSTSMIYFSAMRSPISRLQNRYRYQIILRFKLDKEIHIVNQIYQIVSNNLNSKFQVFIESNPANMS